MDLLYFSEKELEKTGETADSPLDIVTRHLGETALAHREELSAVGGGLCQVLTELAEVRQKIEAVSNEIAEEVPAEKKPSGASRWKKFLSLGTRIASTTRITTLRRKETKLLTSAGWLFSQAVSDGTLAVPDPVKLLSERVLLLTRDRPKSDAGFKNVLDGTVGFLKTAAGKAKKLISSESLKTDLRHLQNERNETFLAVGQQAAELDNPTEVLPEFPVHQIHLLKQEINRLNKQTGGEELAEDKQPDDQQSEFFSAIAKKTGDFIETERLKTELSQREQELNKIYLETGEAIYRLFEKKELIDEHLWRKCKPLKSLNFSIRQKEIEVKRIMEEVAGDDLVTMLHKRMSQDDATDLDQKIMERYGRHLTIMFTDLKDFTRKSAALEMVEMMEMMQEHDDLIIPVIEEHLGRIIKKIGDAIMAVFENPINAVKAAVAVQRKLSIRNQDISDPSRKIQIRIGINCGMVLEKEGDVYGDPVNMASRVEGLAKEEQIFITHDVFDFLDEDEILCATLPPQKVKGKDEPIQIYEVQY